jgi:hypothetical protein
MTTDDRPSIAELQAALPVPWDGKRPPYGETDPRFDLDSARSVLSSLEHAPLSQDNSDTLFVELRMACRHVDRIAPIANAAAVLLEIAAAALAKEEWGRSAAKVRHTLSARCDNGTATNADYVAAGNADLKLKQCCDAYTAALAKVRP